MLVHLFVFFSTLYIWSVKTTEYTKHSQKSSSFTQLGFDQIKPVKGSFLYTNDRYSGLWPRQWDSGEIPFVINYFSASPSKLMTLVEHGHKFLEKLSCLEFQPMDPIEVANKENYTYIYYTFSSALETCCAPTFTGTTGRRVLLITPLCMAAQAVAHVTLHGLGMTHMKHTSFHLQTLGRVLFPSGKNCTKLNRAMRLFHAKNRVKLATVDLEPA